MCCLYGMLFYLHFSYFCQPLLNVLEKTRLEIVSVVWAAHVNFKGMVLGGIWISLCVWVCSLRLELICFIESVFKLASCLCLPFSHRVQMCACMRPHTFLVLYFWPCWSFWVQVHDHGVVFVHVSMCVRTNMGWLTVTSKGASSGGKETREGSSLLHIRPCCYQLGLERRESERRRLRWWDCESKG